MDENNGVRASYVRQNFKSVAVRILAIFVIVWFNCVQADAQGNFENYQYTVRVRYQRCSTYSYHTCSYSWWGWAYNCRYVYYPYCWYDERNEERTARRCKAGWMEPYCTTAICSPACTGGKYCKAPPQTCECLRSGGGECTNVACTNGKDCYPGTCAADGRSCACPPGFGGDNCNSVQMTAQIKDCKVSIHGGSPERELASSECVADGVTPPARWLSTATPARLRISWRPEFRSQALALPRVNYVENSPVAVGITGAKFTVQATSGTYTGGQKCLEDQWERPHAFQECDVQVANWANMGLGAAVTHNTQINITTMTQTGGQKKGNSRETGGNFPAIRMPGLEIKTYAQFTVDLRPPTHCLLEKGENENSDCTCFPIYLTQDVLTNPKIEAQMCGWSDDLSGIARYHVEVFKMTQDALDSSMLVEGRDPVYQTDIIPPQYSFHYETRSSGVYSIQLTAYDNANNSARARKIVNYAGDAMWNVNTSVNVHIHEAAASTNFTWINYLPAGSDGKYRLTLDWTHRYKSNAKYQEEFLKAIKPWTTDGRRCEPSNRCVDDKYDGRFGLRTVSTVPKNASQDINFNVAYSTHDRGGEGLVAPNNSWSPSKEQQKVLEIPTSSLRDGQHVVVWFVASDMLGNRDEMTLKVGLDRSPPVLSTVPNQPDDEFGPTDDDEFMSSLHMNVKDPESGIGWIKYWIEDKRLRNTIYENTETRADVLSVPRQHDDTRETRVVEKRAAHKLCPPGGDSTCYCIPMGTCFPLRLTVNVENCKFDHYATHPLVFHYEVYSGAGLKHAGSIQPTPEQLQAARCRPTDFTVAVKAGIGIAIAIPMLLVLILSALMVWHWKKYNDPLPMRIRTAYNRTVRRGASHNRHDNNPLYASYIKDARSVYGRPPPYSRVGSDKGACNDEEYGTANDLTVLTVSASQVTAEKTLAEGKFAVVKAGTANMNKERTAVAIKMLKRGFSSDDRQLMDLKISFLSSISPHTNLVKFIASYDGGDEGPVMLLELCDMPLKDWLSEHSKSTVDSLEEILTFVQGVARGVQHLHTRSIVHRRLGVRNVLLKRLSSGFVAKLIGFGPSAEDIVTGKDTSRPLRWLAPETLNTLKSQTPTYNNKTDAWAFGITVWEMYSKGEKPYPGQETREIKGYLSRGQRMSCPKDCPPDLFTSVVSRCWDASADKRPEFDVICSAIDSFRGSGAPQDDYYTSDEAAGGGGQTNYLAMGQKQEMYDDGR